MLETVLDVAEKIGYEQAEFDTTGIRRQIK